MQDFYLKFESKTQAQSVLHIEQYPVLGATLDGKEVISDEPVLIPVYANIDVIGVIYKNGDPLDGWHVNVRLLDGEDATALGPYRIEVNTPTRVWA
jgi:hypothetical protein